LRAVRRVVRARSAVASLESGRVLGASTRRWGTHEQDHRLAALVGAPAGAPRPCTCRPVLNSNCCGTDRSRTRAMDSAVHETRLALFFEKSRWLEVPPGFEPQAAQSRTLTISRVSNDHTGLRGAVLPGAPGCSCSITWRVAATWQRRCNPIARRRRRHRPRRIRSPLVSKSASGGKRNAHA
jgi:hypothetical protein